MYSLNPKTGNVWELYMQGCGEPTVEVLHYSFKSSSLGATNSRLQILSTGAEICVNEETLRMHAHA